MLESQTLPELSHVLPQLLTGVLLGFLFKLDVDGETSLGFSLKRLLPLFTRPPQFPLLAIPVIRASLGSKIIIRRSQTLDQQLIKDLKQTFVVLLTGGKLLAHYFDLVFATVPLAQQKLEPLFLECRHFQFTDLEEGFHIDVLPLEFVVGGDHIITIFVRELDGHRNVGQVILDLLHHLLL